MTDLQEIRCKLTRAARPLEPYEVRLPDSRSTLTPAEAAAVLALLPESDPPRSSDRSNAAPEREAVTPAGETGS